MEDLTGKQFGHYQIIAPFGEGGMAAVFKAYQPAMERFVAIKVLPRHMAASREFLARFQLEAKLLAQLQHPHILPVFDFGEAEGYTYIVMPLVQGGTLSDLIRRRRFSVSEARDIIFQIGSALGYAHARGMIHRDVKPSNVLIDESGNCLLTDFGLARMLESTSNLTSTGAIVGTPAYMAPEQGVGGKIDKRSDIYSLGIIFFELLSGRVPYTADTPIAIVFKHIQDPLPSVKKYNPDLPAEVEMILYKVLAKNPEDRYQTVEDFLRALQQIDIPEKLPVWNGELQAPEDPERLATEKLAREQAERKAAEKLAHEKAELEAIEQAAREQAELEAAEKLAREKAELEAAEKLAREKAEREAREKASRERAEREAAEKLAREQVERENAEKAARAQASETFVAPKKHTGPLELGQTPGPEHQSQVIPQQTPPQPANYTGLLTILGLAVFCVIVLGITFVGYQLMAAAQVSLDATATAESIVATDAAATVESVMTANANATGTAIVQTTATARAKATQTASANATATVAVAHASATAFWKQATVSDQFNNNSNKWVTPTLGTGSEYWAGSGSIANGVYQFDVTQVKKPFLYSLAAPVNTANDFDISVAAKRVSGTLGQVCYGVYFRFTSTQKSVQKYYVFTVCDNQNYSVEYFDGTKYQTIKAWTVSTAIRAGEWNTLWVSGRKNVFTLYVNDVKIDTVKDSTLPSGWSGLFFEVFDNKTATVQFDKFSFIQR